MDYHEAADFLYGLGRYPPRRGTEPTRELLAHLGDPQDGLTCLQVAGSNGKGTTARMVERICAAAGYRVGLYTSPHLDDVRERVRVEDRPVPKAAVCAFVETVEDYVRRKAANGDAPTFFEALTALSFFEFDRQDVDIAVLEVGIGGRYDATSAVSPVASAVTSVTLEHTDFLGDTIEEIARDKAHVAPEDGPLVTATDGEALAAVRERAEEVVTVGSVDGRTGAVTGGPEDEAPDVKVTYGGHDGVESVLDLAGEDWSVSARTPALGAHAARNAGVAAALAKAAVGVTTEDVVTGLRGAHWPGRVELVGREPLTILDGAHNPGAAEALSRTLSEFEYDDCHLVVGAMADKDHPGFARALPTAATVHTCRPEVSRAESADVLATVYEETGADRVSAVGDVDAAFDAAVEAAAPGDCVLVTGSLYVVGAARARFARTTVPVRADTPAAARRAMAVTDVPDGEASAHVDDVLTQTVRTRVGPGRADRVRAAVLAAGGTCVLSGVDADEEARDLLVNGSLSTLEDAADRLAEDGLTATAGDLRRAVGHTGNHDGARALSLATTAEDPPWGTTPPWADGTAVMGILNITPDSFHDGGEYDAVPAARRRAEEMVAAGVDVLDVGGESTRPGADPVSPTVERERVVPVIEAIADLDALVSVDTRKAAVARAAIEAGADMINDVSGLSDPEMRFVAAETGAGLVVMHSIDAPVVPDHVVDYDDVVADLVADLRERVFLAERAGVPRDRIVVDPGVGFGKSPPESFELLDRVDEFHALGLPVLVGHSHKSMFGALGYEDGDRLPATVAATALAVDRGADLVRVHDAVENVAAVRTALATRGRFDD